MPTANSCPPKQVKANFLDQYTASRLTCMPTSLFLSFKKLPTGGRSKFWSSRHICWLGRIMEVCPEHVIIPLCRSSKNVLVLPEQIADRPISKQQEYHQSLLYEYVRNQLTQIRPRFWYRSLTICYAYHPLNESNF